MGFARFEPGMRGPWPAKQYGKLVGCLGQIINSLALLSGAYGHMDRTWAKRLAENADTLHPSFVSPQFLRNSGLVERRAKMVDCRYVVSLRSPPLESKTRPSLTSNNTVVRKTILPPRKQTCAPTPFSASAGRK